MFKEINKSAKVNTIYIKKQVIYNNSKIMNMNE